MHIFLQVLHVCMYLYLHFTVFLPNMFWWKSFREKETHNFYFFPIAFPIFLKISEKSQKPAYFCHLHIVYLNVFIMIGAWGKYVYVIHMWQFPEYFSWSNTFRKIGFTKFLLFLKLYEGSFILCSSCSIFLKEN